MRRHMRPCIVNAVSSFAVTLAVLLAAAGCQSPQSRWADAEAQGTRKAYLEYLDGRCEEPFITRAGERILRMQLDEAVASGDPDRIRAFAMAKSLPHRRLNRYRMRVHTPTLKLEAWDKYHGLERELLFAKVVEENSIASCKLYLQRYPTGPHGEEIGKTLHALEEKARIALQARQDEVRSRVRCFKISTRDLTKPGAKRYDYSAAVQRLVRCCTDLEAAPAEGGDAPILNVELRVEQIALGANYWQAGHLYTGYECLHRVTATITEGEIRATRSGGYKTEPRGSIPVMLRNGKKMADVDWSSWRRPERMYTETLWPSVGSSNELQQNLLNVLLEALGPRHMFGKLIALCCLERRQPDVRIADGVWPTRAATAAWWHGQAAGLLTQVFREPLPTDLMLHHVNAEDWWVRKMIAWNLRADDTPAVTKSLLAMTADENASVRMAAICALDGRGGEDVTAALVGLLNDSRARVREASADALLRRGWKPAGPRQRVLLALARTDLAELEQLDDSAAEPLVHALSDDDWLARRSLIDIAGRMEKTQRAAFEAALRRAEKKADGVVKSRLVNARMEIAGRAPLLSAELVEKEYAALEEKDIGNVSICVGYLDRARVMAELKKRYYYSLYWRNPKAYIGAGMRDRESRAGKQIFPVVAVTIWEQWLRDPSRGADGDAATATPLAYALAFAPNSRERILRILPGGKPALAGQPATNPTQREEMFARKAIEALGRDDEKGPKAGLVLVLTPEFLDSADSKFSGFTGDILDAVRELVGAKPFRCSLTICLPAPIGPYSREDVELTGDWLTAAAGGQREHEWRYPLELSNVEGVIAQVWDSKEGYSLDITSPGEGAPKTHTVTNLLCTRLKKGDTVRKGDILGLRKPEDGA